MKERCKDFDPLEIDILKEKVSLYITKRMYSKGDIGLFTMIELKHILEEIKQLFKSEMVKIFQHYESEKAEISSTNLDEDYAKVDGEKEVKLTELKQDLEESLQKIDEVELEDIREIVQELNNKGMEIKAKILVNKEYKSLVNNNLDAYRQELDEKLEQINLERREITDQKIHYMKQNIDKVYIEDTEDMKKEREIEIEKKIKESEDETFVLIQNIYNELSTVHNISMEEKITQRENITMKFEDERSSVQEKLVLREEESKSNYKKFTQNYNQAQIERIDQLKQQNDEAEAESKSARSLLMFYGNWLAALQHLKEEYTKFENIYKEVTNTKRTSNKMKKTLKKNKEEIKTDLLNLEKSVRYDKELKQFYLQTTGKYNHRNRTFNQDLQTLQRGFKAKLNDIYQQRLLINKENDEKVATKKQEQEMETSTLVASANDKWSKTVKLSEKELEQNCQLKEKLLNDRTELYKIMESNESMYNSGLDKFYVERDKRRAMQNQLQDLKHCAKIICRLRPLRENKNEIDFPVIYTSIEGMIEIFHRSTEELAYYEFDKVYNSLINSNTISTEILSHYRYFLEGNDICLITHGDNSIDDEVDSK